MSQHGTWAARNAHPWWCDRRCDGSDNDHDPHLSARERISADFPSDLVVEAYLLQTRKPVTEAPLAALEFHDPGTEEPVQILMTSRQLRRLYEALSRLVHTAEQPDRPQPAYGRAGVGGRGPQAAG